MTTTNEGLFQDQPQGNQPVVEGKEPGSTENDKSQDALALLVGEGRKYKTVEDLAKAYMKADDFIEVLKNDNGKLKENLAKAKTVDDVLERLDQSRQQSGDDASRAQAISVADIEKIVEARLTGRETAKARDANIAKAQALLVEKFGEKAKEVFLKAADTPEKRQAMNSLAAVSPEMFAQLFSTAPVVTNQSDGSTARSTSAPAQNAVGRAADPDCKEFYDEMRRKKPSEYYSQKMQLEIHKRFNRNPEKFLGRKIG